MTDDCCGGGGGEGCCGGGGSCGCDDPRPIQDGGIVVEQAPVSDTALEEPGVPPSLEGPEWEAWAEEILEGTDYDTGLGKDLARDALRIANGELSAAEFHERYGEAVLDEFGVDERPTKRALERPRNGNGGPLPRVPEVAGPTVGTRRSLLKALGGAAAAGATAGLAGCLGRNEGSAAPAAVQENDQNASDNTSELAGSSTEGVQLGMVVDTDACIACLQCGVACKEENNTSVGVQWPYVFRYEDHVGGETVQGQLTRHCQHCTRASCTYVCPTEARHKRTEDGIVLTDYDLCVGCRYCQVACPYGVNYLGTNNPTDLSDGFNYRKADRNGRTVAGPPPEGVMGKCTYCVHRQDSDDPELQGTTACVDACPPNALHFGDLNDPESPPRQYLKGKFPGREDVPEKHRFKLLEETGNQPNSIYVGNEPSDHAEPIEGPVAYRDHGMVGGAYPWEQEDDSE